MSRTTLKYNYSKILGIMREQKMTQRDLAQKIGISEVSLNKKLTNKTQFKQDEMASILTVLGFSVHDVATIFFSH